MIGIWVRHPALAGPPRPACALIDIRGVAGCQHPILTWKAVMRAGRWHTERTGVPVPDSGRRNRVPRGRSSMPAKHQDRPSPSFRCCANSTPPIRPHERARLQTTTSARHFVLPPQSGHACRLTIGKQGAA